jgi:hypothetical protein
VLTHFYQDHVKEKSTAGIHDNAMRPGRDVERVFREIHADAPARESLAPIARQASRVYCDRVHISRTISIGNPTRRGAEAYAAGQPYDQ